MTVGRLGREMVEKAKLPMMRQGDVVAVAQGKKEVLRWTWRPVVREKAKVSIAVTRMINRGDAIAVALAVALAEY